MSAVPLVLTRHAVQRFRERFDPKATEETIVHLASTAEPAPTWVRRYCNQLQPGSVMLRNGPVLFVVLDRRILTCVPMAWKEDARLKLAGAKRNKIFRKKFAKRQKPSTLGD